MAIHAVIINQLVFNQWCLFEVLNIPLYYFYLQIGLISRIKQPVTYVIINRFHGHIQIKGTEFRKGFIFVFWINQDFYFPSLTIFKKFFPRPFRETDYSIRRSDWQLISGSITASRPVSEILLSLVQPTGMNNSKKRNSSADIIIICFIITY